MQISWGKQDLFANFRLVALALPFVWALLWVPFIFHLLQHFRLQELWWKTLKRRPQLYQCCNRINHTFIPRKRRLWFEEFTQLSLRAVPDELWWNWLWQLDVPRPQHSQFSAEGRQKASGTCLVSGWDHRGARAKGHWAAEAAQGYSACASSIIAGVGTSSITAPSSADVSQDPHVVFSENPPDLLTLLIQRSFPKVFWACGACQ